LHKIQECSFTLGWYTQTSVTPGSLNVAVVIQALAWA